MLKDLVLNSQTRQTVEHLLATPPHALLITAPDGAGKTSLALELSGEWLGAASDKLVATSRFMQVEPIEDERYGVAAVAEIQHFLMRRAAPLANGIAKVALITEADGLRHEAQNKLLKTLEEPPVGCMLILTAVNVRSVLPTITSRCQVLELARPSQAELSEWLTGRGNTSEAVKLAISAADGWPGGALRILNGQGNEAGPVQLARQVLAADSFQRLAQVDQLSKDRDQAIAICQTLQQMAHLALAADSSNAKRWLQVEAAAYDCEASLRINTNRKLALTSLMLSL